MRCALENFVAVLILSIPVGAWGGVAAAAEPSPPEYEMTRREAWIPMPDGVRLSADLFLPQGGKAGQRFPVLLEYLPYRKVEDRGRNHALYSYFVRRGYAVARVDIRGTGSSEGTLVEYEYSEQEQRDAESAIDWLSKQPFSTGDVGMFGISWGGFNSIHLAMRRPPALKAIVAIMATDDLFQDDVHYIDGQLCIDTYEIAQDLENSLPAAPDFIIDEAYFVERFETTPWLLNFKRQQRDGPFWNRSSLNERYDAIEIPTFVISGWYDQYPDSLLRMIEHLKVPKKAIIGPWAHALPHNGYPKPHIEWRNEAVRWFDHWLKGRDTGIVDEPSFAVFVRDWHPPDPGLEEVPGQWRFEEGWPLARARTRKLYPQPDRSLGDAASESGTHELKYVPTVGVENGLWSGEIVLDQRPIDSYSLVYDTDPLEEDLEILGMPRVTLNASADAPMARWFVRLSDVAPDGTVTQTSWAGFNGAQRNSAENPEPMEPGRIYPMEIELRFTSWIFPKGHRIRLSINNAQWPMIWPSPDPMTTHLKLGGNNPTRVELPVVPYEDRPAPNFLPPAEDPKLAGHRSVIDVTASGYSEVTTIERDVPRAATKVVARNAGRNEFPWGSISQDDEIVYEAQDAHPEAASVTSEMKRAVQVGGRNLVWQGVLDFRSDRENFYYTYTRRLFEEDRKIREKTWKETIPRDFQ
ncbi:MAG: CocE/NonD family hydrolase [Deltaproteobacteria bacterium]|jgi:predicted acyl esterase|nr:CocE/NonD family hydrolase [Deltaproteobacteria bacterium]